MLKEERFNFILNKLQQDQKVLLGRLSSELAISEDTVRRDIKELSDQGLLMAVRGGAVINSHRQHDFKDRIGLANKQKQVIARKALTFLQNGQVVILDGGTSVMALASILPKDLNITVVTNSFPVANILEDHEQIEVLFAGGRLLKSSFITVGNDTIEFYKSVQADICFLGVCSIHPDNGLTGHYYDECAVKKSMITSSKIIIALSTPEKINTVDSFGICPARALSTIVTTTPEETSFEPFKNIGIKII